MESIIAVKGRIESGKESGRKKREKGTKGFLKPLISAYSTLPLHGITAIPGKISGALLVIDAIEDAVPLIHGPIGCAFQRKINPFKPYSPFYETPCTNMNDVDVVYGGEDKLSRGIKINKVCFDHSTVNDLYELPKADLTITDYPMVWARLMKERFDVDHYEILAWDRYKQTKDPELFSPYGIDGSTMIFMEIAQRLGKEGEAFECPIEFAIQLKEALKKPQQRNPLLSMLEYDQYRTNLIPEWATLADLFGTLREEAVGDKDRCSSM